MITMMNSTMSKSPILEGKHAVVFGAGGSIGAAVAREFAVEGRRSFWPAGPNRMWKKSRSESPRRAAVLMRQ